MNFVDKDLFAVQEARIRMEEAKEAAKVLCLFDQEKLDQILSNMLKTVRLNLEELSRMAVLETGYGRWQDQYEKAWALCEGLENNLDDLKCVGILRKNTSEGTMEIGVPRGVIASVCPAVNPVMYVLNMLLLAVKTGNAVILVPHKRAVRTTIHTAEILQQAAQEAGFPEGAISWIQTPDPEGTKELFRSPIISLLVVTEVPDVLKQLKLADKPVICGGIAPSPVFIERTADVKKAAEDIVLSRSFDCGISAASEQYLVVDSQVAEEAKMELMRNGAWFMNEEEERKLIELLGIRYGNVDEECIGKSAYWLASKAGFSVLEDTRILVSSQPYISGFNPYAKALLCPVLAFYIEEDWVHACEKCMNLLVEESCGNTLAIHSQDEEIIRQFVLKKPVGRILINTPASLGAMGITANLFPSATLGSASAGQGMIADNLSPRDLIYIRKAAFGVREFELKTNKNRESDTESDETSDTLTLLKLIMEQLTERS